MSPSVGLPLKPVPFPALPGGPVLARSSIRLRNHVRHVAGQLALSPFDPGAADHQSRNFSASRSASAWGSPSATAAAMSGRNPSGILVPLDAAGVVLLLSFLLVFSSERVVSGSARTPSRKEDFRACPTCPRTSSEVCGLALFSERFSALRAASLARRSFSASSAASSFATRLTMCDGAPARIRSSRRSGVSSTGLMPGASPGWPQRLRRWDRQRQRGQRSAGTRAGRWYGPCRRGSGRSLGGSAASVPCSGT